MLRRCLKQLLLLLARFYGHLIALKLFNLLLLAQTVSCLRWNDKFLTLSFVFTFARIDLQFLKFLLLASQILAIAEVGAASTILYLSYAFFSQQKMLWPVIE